MSSSDSFDDDASPDDSGPTSSRDAVTPRGGFMARPGMKVPPRHAVIVRVGDAPESDDIPLARSSVPPPPPSEPAPAPVSASEKITLRAIRAPSAPQAVAPTSRPPSEPPPSCGPLSDAPLIAASVRPTDSSLSGSRRQSRGSTWTIALAAAAGLVLGLASVASRMKAPEAAVQPPPVTLLEVRTKPSATPARVGGAAPSASSAARTSAAPSSAAPANTARIEQRPLAAPRPEPAGAKRSIF